MQEWKQEHRTGREKRLRAVKLKAVEHLRKLAAHGITLGKRFGLALLVALLLPALSSLLERSRRIVCMSNVRQSAIGMLLYAKDDAHGSLSGKTHSEDQDLNRLVSGYAEERKGW